MCRLSTLDLPPEPRSTPDARAFLLSCLRAWQLELLADALELPLSELVTNALLHARTPLAVTVRARKEHVEVAVADRSPELPQPRPERQDLHADLEALRHVELGVVDPLDERDPRLDVGDAGSVVGGRGLLLVQTLVESWGVRPTAEGKEVWVRAVTPPEWPAGTGCTCGTEVVDRS